MGIEPKDSIDIPVPELHCTHINLVAHNYFKQILSLNNTSTEEGERARSQF